jgi:hypothetical protein
MYLNMRAVYLINVLYHHKQLKLTNTCKCDVHVKMHKDFVVHVNIPHNLLA